MVASNALTRSERSPAQTRRAILDAAESCFREFGFDGARGAEIARRAGVSEGSVFQHYNSKMGLLTAVTIEFYDAVQEEAEDVLLADTDAVERFRGLVDGWATRIETDWPLIRVFALKSQNEPTLELSIATTPLLRRYTRLFLGVIDELKAEGMLPTTTPTALIRNMLFGMLEHTARGQDIAGKQIEVREVAQQAIDLLLGTGRTVDYGTELRTIEQKLDTVLDRLGPPGNPNSPSN